MKRKSPINIIVIFLLFLIVVPASVAAGETKNSLEFGLFNMPPFYTLEDGKPAAGICVEVMEGLLRSAAIPYHMKVYPTARLYFNLASGKTDLFVGIKEVAEYKDKVLFSEAPVADAELGIYYREGTLPIQSKSDFVGKRIIVVRGYSYAGLIKYLEDPKNNIRLEVTDSHQDALNMLEMRRADYFLDYTMTVEDLLLEHPELHIRHTVYNTFPLYLIVSRNTPGAEEIMGRLTKEWKLARRNK